MEESKSLDIIKHAILLERRGRAFYRKVSARINESVAGGKVRATAQAWSAPSFFRSTGTSVHNNVLKFGSGWANRTAIDLCSFDAKIETSIVMGIPA